MSIQRFASRAICAMFFPLVLVACDEEQEDETNVESARPVKTIVVGEASDTDQRRFPARVESSQRADLAFRVRGKVQEVLVSEGERIPMGTVIAELDSTDYQLVVDERTARFEQTEAEFIRTETLYNRGFSTRQVYESRKAEMQSAQAEMRLAQQNLRYTKLIAPFEGELARRFVENFEDVEANQAIVSMRNTQSLEIKFDVPERIMIQIAESGDEAFEPEVQASFSAAPNQTFRLAYKESAAFADPDTQTFEVTYVMDAPSELTVLPGMTATAIVDFRALAEIDNGNFVPVEAVVGTNELGAEVWIVDEENLTVAPSEVTVGEMRGGLIEVTSGLEPGARIVVAGVPFLVDGMDVTIMPDVEQAAERLDDATIRRAAESDLQNGATDGQADQ